MEKRKAAAILILNVLISWVLAFYCFGKIDLCKDNIPLACEAEKFSKNTDKFITFLITPIDELDKNRPAKPDFKQKSTPRPKPEYDKSKDLNNNQEVALFMRNIEKKIKKNWHPQKEEISTRVVVLFYINNKGELLSSKIQSSTASEENNKIALETIENSAPFDVKMPEPLKKLKKIPIEFTFDYNVKNQKK